MIKKFNQYNESLRDKMTPIDDEKIREIIGDDEVYKNVYKILKEKVKEFKPPFVPELTFAEWSRKYIQLKVTIHGVKYYFKIKDDKWGTFYSWGRDNETRVKEFDTWDEAYQNMKEELKEHFNKDLESEKRTLGYTEERIKKLENTLQEIDKL